MLEKSKFKSALKSFATTQSKLFEQAQALALFCIYNVCEHNNVEPVKQLMEVLLVPQGKKKIDNEEVMVYRPKSNDAKRILQFVQDFCPCHINMERSIVKYSSKRAENGLIWLGKEEAYPLWYVYVKADKVAKLKVVDGIGLFRATVAEMVKKVKAGKVQITPESQAAFEALVTQTEHIMSSIVEAQQQETA